MAAGAASSAVSNLVTSAQTGHFSAAGFAESTLQGAAEGAVFGGLAKAAPALADLAGGILGSGSADTASAITGATAEAGVDANPLIRGLDYGEMDKLDAALAGRAPVVSPQAASEYLARGNAERCMHPGQSQHVWLRIGYSADCFCG
jgi:hypothetical protein